jgi:hypothetical protein
VSPQPTGSPKRYSVVRRLGLVLLTATIALVSCVGGTTIDYVDFIQHGDIQYVAPFSSGLGRSPADADLGPEQFRVTQTLAHAGRGAGYAPHDGDAAFVPVGDPVYAVRGYAPSFRLAARHDGRLVLYEADSNPAAKTGADLLDIDGRVSAIALLSQKDGRTVIGRISDPGRVAELVRVVVTGPIVTSRPASAPGMGVVVAFELADGTVTARGYAVDTSILGRGIHAAGAFHDAIVELVANAPTPTSAPLTANLARRYELAKAARVTIKGAVNFKQDPALVGRLAAVLDRDLPAFATSSSSGGNPLIVIFEFPDHYVSLAFDAATNTLSVVSPEDGFGVHADPAIADALAAASR